ncbi:sensor histidine kinase [Rhodoferax ferrireducens]|uniref:sensor histidine kinase n=1 Tax=Rhodoferax ferrireducens TaxID=192843 RepID=UPI000E0D3126|nr:ATP-binding protein [Rhodoferax ferrireducens]
MTDTPQALLLENEQLRRELGQARAELEDFTHSVSHDLRASLRHVNAYVHIIKEDLGEQTPVAVAAHLDTVSQAARQMGRQIDGLMELARLTRVELQLSTVDVAQLVDDTCTALAPALAARTIEWQIAPDLPALRCDAALLRQVLTHLLSNAVKFTAARAVAEIHVSWQSTDNGQCALTVADNGAGFNPQYTDKLFHAFQRLHGAREFEGLGMGLALTRKIVERHGGMVWAKGIPDAGCSVSVTLPMA